MSNVPQTVFELTCLRKHTRAHNALPCSRNARCPHWLVLTRRRSSKEGFGGINRGEESFSKKTYETKSLHTTRGGSPLPVQHPEKEVLDESVCLPPATSMPGMSLAFFMDIPDFIIDEGQRHPGMNRYQCTCLCELPCAQPKGSEKVRSKLGI